MPHSFSARRSARCCVRTILLAWCLCVPLQAQDEPVPAADPYTVRVPIEQDDARTREAALREALALVLEAVVGRKDAAFDSLLPRATQWAQQYGVVARADGEGLEMKARFDPKAVEEALRSRGLPVFGIDASLIEGWALHIAGVHAASDYSRLLDYLAGLRGVRRVDVEQLSDDALLLRLTVEGGIKAVREQVDGDLMVRPEGEGFYVFVGR